MHCNRQNQGHLQGPEASLDAAAIMTLNEMAASGIAKVDIATALGISRASVYQ
ncbi:DNA-binding CsgD family transcriptional regulator [Variovorax boronicumulans]|uniref:hypothetical protein n=1 Tax=Variovorax boronicumulans TaxID=436515 RepID=UPI00277DF001|nr:hypothetical protein [Variovorax boronicumulans]MDP9993817.1 DNA-binding CsgD family transcriptional regulator [Variovorax boronicumulans]MDQ0005318.1 DNA-binding CsgD family transcriptional regulator [Variovorax boronicumulans]